VVTADADLYDGSDIRAVVYGGDDGGTAASMAAVRVERSTWVIAPHVAVLQTALSLESRDRSSSPYTGTLLPPHREALSADSLLYSTNAREQRQLGRSS
jgi:hypothetical protein